MNKIVIVTGPTASGKTDFAIKLAQELDGEIINADSMQVYQENPILSAQPTIKMRKNIPHHLFGYIKGNEEYNVARWIDEASSTINNMEKTPILVGGTGFYLKHLIFGMVSIPEIPGEVRKFANNLLEQIGAEEFYKILKSLDPIAADRLSPNNTHRTLRAYEVFKATGKPLHYWQEQKNTAYFPINKFELIILLPERNLLYENCNKRLLQMLQNEALEEVKYLAKQNYNPLKGVMKTHGVPEFTKYLNGEWTLEMAIEKASQAVRNYAKRQTTWLKHQFNHSELKVRFLSNELTNN